MGFLLDKCTLQVYNAQLLAFCDTFDCDNADLNDFFRDDALNYQSELLGKTYCFTLDENPKIIKFKRRLGFMIICIGQAVMYDPCK